MSGKELRLEAQKLGLSVTDINRFRDEEISKEVLIELMTRKHLQHLCLQRGADIIRASDTIGRQRFQDAHGQQIGADFYPVARVHAGSLSNFQRAQLEAGSSPSSPSSPSVPAGHIPQQMKAQGFRPSHTAAPRAQGSKSGARVQPETFDVLDAVKGMATGVLGGVFDGFMGLKDLADPIRAREAFDRNDLFVAVRSIRDASQTKSLLFEQDRHGRLRDPGQERDRPGAEGDAKERARDQEAARGTRCPRRAAGADF